MLTVSDQRDQEDHDGIEVFVRFSSMAWRSLNGSILVLRYFHIHLYVIHSYTFIFLPCWSSSWSYFPLTMFSQVLRASFLILLPFFDYMFCIHLVAQYQSATKSEHTATACVANLQLLPMIHIRIYDFTDPSHPTKHPHRPTRRDDRRPACTNRQRARSLGLAS